MHVDLDPTPAGRDAFKYCLPKVETAFFDAALAMDSESDAADRRTFLEQQPHRIAAIWAVILSGQSLDGVIRVRAVEPFIAVHPQPELKLHAARHSLLADKLQHREIAIALGVR